jgi:glycolate oxidase FAD binding subunit
MLDLPNPFLPRDAADVLQIVRDAADAKRPLEILGQGSKRGIGHSVAAQHIVDMSNMSGVVFYEPDEIVLSVHAGTPIAEIETLLAKENQELAFEPMDYGPLFGRPRGGGTIGGALAANISGPRRIKAGAARDHVLGVQAVSGRGEAFKSGGRVVKNVTGYDLSKGLAGSWGTLAVLTDVTFKTLPRAEAASTLAVFGLDDRTGVDVLCAAMGSTGEISGAAHLPADAAGALPQLSASGASCTLLRLEGFRPSVLYRAERVAAMIGGEGREIVRIDDAESVALWRAIRDAEPFAGGERAVWRVSVAPASGPVLLEALAGKMSVRHFYDWSGGLVWLDVLEPLPDAGAETIRSCVRTVGGGHATLIRAPGVDQAVPRFEPQPSALAALSARLKAGFDPLNILNPGRMA